MQALECGPLSYIFSLVPTTESLEQAINERTSR